MIGGRSELPHRRGVCLPLRERSLIAASSLFFSLIMNELEVFRRAAPSDKTPKHSQTVCVFDTIISSILLQASSENEPELFPQTVN